MLSSYLGKKIAKHIVMKYCLGKKIAKHIIMKYCLGKKIAKNSTIIKSHLVSAN